MMRYKFLLALILPILTMGISLPETSASETQNLSIRYQAANELKSERRINFDQDLLSALKQYTGPNQQLNLTKVKTEMSLKRALVEVEGDGLINLIISPVRSDISQKARIVEVPLLRGLLGFRQVLTTGNSNEELNNITSVEELRQYRVGQVEGWVDADIYRSNGFSVNSATNLEIAFRMLNGKRFDMLPLGIIEIDKEFSARKRLFPKMQVNDSFFIYYPLPVMIHVSPNQEDLFQFLTNALQRMATDGTLDRLIGDHFGSAVAMLDNENTPIYKLHNPNLPKSIPTAETELWFSSRF